LEKGDVSVEGIAPGACLAVPGARAAAAPVLAHPHVLGILEDLHLLREVGVADL